MSEQQMPQMNAESMYLEEVFTDQSVGQIRRMTPVTADGDNDTSRDVIYVGYTQVMTPGGALPLNFEIEAKSLSEAINSFSEAAELSVGETLKQLEQMQRDRASSIVVPGQMGGGSSIQIP